MDRDRVPLKQPFCRRQKIVCQRMAFQIVYNYCDARDLPKPGEEMLYLIIREVVQEQRAMDNIEALTPKRKTESVSDHFR